MKYSDYSTCPKCGRDSPLTTWEPTTAMLTRRCLRCGYEWRETPLDHPGDTPPVSPPKSDTELTKPERPVLGTYGGRTIYGTHEGRPVYSAMQPEAHPLDDEDAVLLRACRMVATHPCRSTMKPEVHPPDNEELPHEPSLPHEWMIVICNHAEGCTRSGGQCEHLVPHEYYPHDPWWDCAGKLAGPCCWGHNRGLKPIEARCVPVKKGT